MAVRSQTSPPVRGDNLKAAMLAQFTDLLDAHVEQALEFIDQAEDKSTTINMASKIDCSGSSPKIKVSIRFSQSVTDERVAELDDVNQGTFRQITGNNPLEEQPELSGTEGDGAGTPDPAEPPTKRRGRRKKADAEPEAEPETT